MRANKIVPFSVVIFLISASVADTASFARDTHEQVSPS
jgi:hypothetical protein